MKKLLSIAIILMPGIHASSLPLTHYVSTSSPAAYEEIRSNLYAFEANATPFLLDGDLTQFDQSFTNDVDGMDARKMSNFSENLGMIRATTTLVIERRHTITTTDTIFYKMWNMQQRPYRFEFIASDLNHPGLNGYLEDSYLHSSTPINLNDSNYINFSVNADPASSAMYRFRLVFSSATAAMPITFTSVKATQVKNSIIVDFNTKNEANVQEYNIEKSTDGKTFGSVTEVKANNLLVNQYGWTDNYPAEQYNYYRIRGNDISGSFTYSEVVKVFAAAAREIKVFPNPVTGNTIHLQMIDQPAGLYEVKLVNSYGQYIMKKQILHDNGTRTESIMPGKNIPTGIYQLEVTRPGGTKMTMQLMF
jgi:hypothetical protein